MSQIVQNQYSSWQAENSGKWIYNGYIYVGKVGLDPEIKENQVRVFYIDENQQEIDLAQPIRTNSSGFPVISETNSTVIQVRTDSDYSVKALNRKKAQEWYIPKASTLNPDTKDKIYSREFKNISDLKLQIDAAGNQLNLSDFVGNMVLWRGYYSELDGGGNCGIVRSGPHTDDGGKIISINSSVYIEAKFENTFINVRHFGAKGDGLSDDYNAIQNAINSASGEIDVYDSNRSPGSEVHFPRGEYIIKTPLLVQRNRTRITGEGRGVSIIKATNTAIIREVIRFRSVHHCAIENIGLDGGLPFIPDLSESYGAEAGIVFDLCVRFSSTNLQVSRTRLAGVVAVHMWENNHYNLWCTELAYFSNNENKSTRGGAILFTSDDAWKQSGDELGAGYESTNTAFVKPQLSTPGCIIYCEAPTNNITIYDWHGESRGYPSPFPCSNDARLRIATTSGFRMFSGYYYAHANAWSNTGTSLFEIGGGSEGVVLKDMQCLTANTSGNTNPMVPTLINFGGQTEITIDNFVAYDKADLLGSDAFQLLGSSTGRNGYLSGKIQIHAGSNRDVDDYFVNDSTYDGLKSYAGRIDFFNTSSNTNYSNNYNRESSQFDTNSGVNLESYKVRAWANINMKTDSIRGSENILSIVDNGPGIYGFIFKENMPDSNYSIQATGSADTGVTDAAVIRIASYDNTRFAIAYQNQAGTGFDIETCCVSVMR